MKSKNAHKLFNFLGKSFLGIACGCIAFILFANFLVAAIGVAVGLFLSRSLNVDIILNKKKKKSCL